MMFPSQTKQKTRAPPAAGIQSGLEGMFSSAPQVEPAILLGEGANGTGSKSLQ